MSERDRPSLARRAGSRADLWLAVLSGPGPWLDPDVRPSSPDLVAMAGQILGLFTAILFSVAGVIDDGWQASNPARTTFLFVAYFILFVVLAGPTVGWVAGGRLVEPLAERPRAAAALRVVVVVGAVVAWTLRGPRAPALSAWPFGVAGGCEIALTIWAIGIRARPLVWWRSFLVSGPHIGSIVALVGILLVKGPGQSWKPLLGLYLALHAVIAVLAITIAGLERIRRTVETDLARREREVLADEHRRRAHWLHDEVCTRLGFVQKRLESGQVAPLAVAAELGQLDHSLRERQLEELMGAGEVQLAEVVQPYLRMAQQQGVMLTDVPDYEIASSLLPGTTGRLAQRVLSNVVGNAIKAGATEMAIRVSLSTGDLIIDIEDNAGGFDLKKLEPGRGLDRLRTELGPDRLRFTATASGTVVRALIAVQDATGAARVKE